jgi:hypothetical protein
MVVVLGRGRVRTTGSLVMLVMVHSMGPLVDTLVCPRWDLPPPGWVSRLVRGIVIGPAFSFSFGFVSQPLRGRDHCVDHKAKKAQKDDESDKRFERVVHGGPSFLITPRLCRL